MRFLHCIKNPIFLYFENNKQLSKQITNPLILSTAFYSTQISIKPLFSCNSLKKSFIETRTLVYHICSPLISASEWDCLSSLQYAQSVSVACTHISRLLQRRYIVTSFPMLSNKSVNADEAHACLLQSMINKPISLAQRNKWDNHIYQVLTLTDSRYGSMVAGSLL